MTRCVPDLQKREYGTRFEVFAKISAGKSGTVLNLASRYLLKCLRAGTAVAARILADEAEPPQAGRDRPDPWVTWRGSSISPSGH
jgi:hypothetical protein